jgi:hypothetical protein
VVVVVGGGSVVVVASASSRLESDFASFESEDSSRLGLAGSSLGAGDASIAAIVVDCSGSTVTNPEANPAAATLADNCVGSSAADTGFCSGEDPRAETAAKPSAAIRITINDPVAEI